jgi:hypothetical protein
MHTLHGFAFIPRIFPHPTAPVLARPEPLHAPALKPTYKAGRRGGESIARWNNNYLFSRSVFVIDEWQFVDMLERYNAV